MVFRALSDLATVPCVTSRRVAAVLSYMTWSGSTIRTR